MAASPAVGSVLRMMPAMMMAASLLVLATTSANAGMACSPQKACDFVKLLSTTRDPEARISLLCTPAEKCTISGTQLGGEFGVLSTVEMANVLVQNNTAKFGGLLRIQGGSFGPGRPGGVVTGTNITFRNGHGKATSE